MIVDTSAIVAIASNEEDADRLLATLLTAALPRISAGNLLETYMVIDRRRNPIATALLEQIMARIALTVEPVTAEQVEIARDAFRRFGKGSGHPARLNYGDCFAYALARFHDEPLLFVGNDFPQTDIASASREREAEDDFSNADIRP
ncbi:MAG: type II toxin-antitoxin system VapC family toxin [Chloroflexota bacterium]|nr:type II toxin-antitoxin system VapC family toxin [Chloroflexota bacterium]